VFSHTTVKKSMTLHDIFTTKTVPMEMLHTEPKHKTKRVKFTSWWKTFL